MSSPFEGLTDSWQDRQARDRHAAKLLRRAVYRVIALVAGALLGAGLGSVVEAGDWDNAGRRIGRAAAYGLLMAGVLFAALVRFVVRSQMFGRESGLDRGWLFAAVPVGGAILGASMGSGGLSPDAAEALGYRGAQVGGVVGAALVWLAWWGLLDRTRR